MSMLKPSYAELMDVMNENENNDVTSRYTVVIAAAKRARQLIDGDDPMVEEPIPGKPLTTAVTEIFEGKIAVVPEGEGTKTKVRKKKDKLDLDEEIQLAKPNPADEKEDGDEFLPDEDDIAEDRLDFDVQSDEDSADEVSDEDLSDEDLSDEDNSEQFDFE